MNPEVNRSHRESDTGPGASGWMPGDIDANTDTVYRESAPGRPGIAPEPTTVSFGGVIIAYGSRHHLEMLRLGYTEDPEE